MREMLNHTRDSLFFVTTILVIYIFCQAWVVFFNASRKDHCIVSEDNKKLKVRLVKLHRLECIGRCRQVGVYINLDVNWMRHPRPRRSTNQSSLMTCCALDGHQPVAYSGVQTGRIREWQCAPEPPAPGRTGSRQTVLRRPVVLLHSSHSFTGDHSLQ